MILNNLNKKKKSHHYINIEVILMENILWELFKRTGQIKYYHLYQAIIKKK